MIGRADVIVVGLGAMGSSALWRLAARGVDVVGIERFGAAHPFGSSHGRTRLFREACLEHVGLAPIAASSRELTRELEALTRRTLLTITGGLMIGAPDGDIVAGTREAAAANGLPLDELGTDGLPGAHAPLAPGEVIVRDPGAGIIRPEATVSAALDAAEAAGARIRTGTTVRAIESDGVGVVVDTAEGRWRADRVVIATGAWLPGFAPALRLHPIRTPLTWFDPQGPGFGIDELPVFVRQLDEGSVIWGHGRIDGHAVKLGRGDLWGERPPRIEADAVDRGTGDSDWAELAPLVRRALPGVDPRPSRIEPCMITLSPDGQFVLGPAPGDERIILAGGDSGHAFKHAPAIGEILARDATGEAQDLDLGFLRPGRFG
jgi:sarcosine oxidase